MRHIILLVTLLCCVFSSYADDFMKGNHQCVSYIMFLNGKRTLETTPQASFICRIDDVLTIYTDGTAHSVFTIQPDTRTMTDDNDIIYQATNIKEMDNMYISFRPIAHDGELCYTLLLIWNDNVTEMFVVKKETFELPD